MTIPDLKLFRARNPSLKDGKVNPGPAKEQLNRHQASG